MLNDSDKNMEGVTVAIKTIKSITSFICTYIDDTCRRAELQQTTYVALLGLLYKRVICTFINF